MSNQSPTASGKDQMPKAPFDREPDDIDATASPKAEGESIVAAEDEESDDDFDDDEPDDDDEDEVDDEDGEEELQAGG